MPQTRLIFRRLVLFAVMLVLVVPVAMLDQLAEAQPSVPNLISPLDGAITSAQPGSYPPTGMPSFYWEEVSGADRYQIQICPSAGCANPVFSHETYVDRYTPIQTLADGVWYWRVRAHDSDGWGDYSSSWMFTKSWLDYGSLRPVLQEPPDTTVEFFEYPIFSWSAVPGAAYYLIEIARDAGFSDVAYNETTIKATHTPANRLDRGDYYWRVTPVDRRNNYGDASDVRHFFMDYLQVPTLLAPADASHQTFTPEFRWTAAKAADEYHLQVSTVQDFSFTVLDVTPNNTRFTPLDNLENDKEYYWRVAARDQTGTDGPWSEVRSFYMEWHLEPLLLSPKNNYIRAPFPVFIWTPVAGAKKYRIWADTEDSFAEPRKFQKDVEGPVRYNHTNWGVIQVCMPSGPPCPYYWQVKALDNQANEAPWSDTFAVDYSWEPAPTLVYPPPYYDPAVVSSTLYLDIRSDPTVPAPVFMWDRVVRTQGGVSEVSADTYEIQVDDDPAFGSVDWTTTTNNLSIAPSVESNFDMTPGVVYYWRVRAFRGGSPMHDGWSEVWEARFDPSLQELTSTIVPYFPADGWDNVHDTPLFGWSPVEGAAQYHWQISTEPTFDNIVYEAHPIYSFFTPLERLTPETYHWRVKAQDAGGGDIGGWSEVRRVVITYQLRRDYPDFLPLPHPITLESGSTQIGSDGSGDALGQYDLTSLHIAQSNNYWFLTLAMPPQTTTSDIYFVFYVDLDHEAGSGGTSDPLGFDVSADSIYLPERVLYVRYVNDNISPPPADSVILYRWQGANWGPPEPLDDIGGDWNYWELQAVELEIPITVFDLGESWLGTVSVEAFVVDNSPGAQALDTVPAEESSPTSQLTNFTAVSDKLNPLHPWDNPFSNPYVHWDSPMLSFSKPIWRSYVRGYRLQVAKDFEFTNIVHEGNWWSETQPQYWFVGTRYTWVKTFEENNTLYWRIRVKHAQGDSEGPWSQPVRFTKRMYRPATLSTEYEYTTPSFYWDRVEGAANYRIQVDNDFEFGSPQISEPVDSPSYTPPGSLADGTWYWRVRTADGSARNSEYTEAISFTKSSPIPTPTFPINDVVINELPTFQWQPILYPAGDFPVMVAPRYHLMVDDDPNFSSPLIQVALDTTSYTANRSKKIEDGTYYWKVAMLVGTNQYGPYSEPASFYKVYLTPTLSAASFGPVPDLKWEPLDGAAYYQLQICRDPFFADCVESNVSTDLTHYVSRRAASSYPPGVYYWRVRMCDQAAACGPYYEDRQAPGAMIFMPLIYK
jgi:hypothetical protein